MALDISTFAEQQAASAEDLSAFSGLKLLHIKRQVAEILKQIGTEGIFDTYTRHDISHIDEMLKALDWLIPQSTKDVMSPADWLILVLSIYFHDMGMLVTRDEFSNRDRSGYPEYRDRVLFAEAAGTDYRAKVTELEPDKIERFLYQEFVRAKHGERIRYWISGKAHDSLGVAGQVVTEINPLLVALDPQFRQDLGLICESHHLDDLDDFDKYCLSRPYGNSDEETANLQFAAILLRTSDLLHITRDRTPAVAFRLINPSDPISQDEWAKQMAVKSVRPKPALDEDGNVDPNAPRDTVEIHAFFEKPDGFFGLTSYLAYAAEQLKQNFDWLQKDAKIGGSKHLVPWRRIDDANVKTEGFLKQSFEFTLDNARILDLLTGHTLYNDTSVVLRELVQNSLDAVRVQAVIDRNASHVPTAGEVWIHWDSNRRQLEVRDNGTGMTQRIIEEHLLKVGASRYQSQEFNREFPEFSSISRFGIGILSTFMIADEVEVTTCHPEEANVRKLTLRSVHGKYLVQLLDKESDPVARELAPHGTVIRIRVRPSTPKLPTFDILAQARRWIVVPDCKVTVQIDTREPVSVGHDSPRAALVSVLREADVVVDESADGHAAARSVRVIENRIDNVTMAFAVEWSEYFQDWSFLTPETLAWRRGRDGHRTEPLIGVCVEGIRVDFASPGFRQGGILSIANATGRNAPKTNVARSGLENTPERDRLLSAVYTMYCRHVRNELDKLSKERAFSLTWAVGEARVLLGRLLGSGGRAAVEEDVLLNCAKELPVFIVEKNGERLAMSAAQLGKHERFWTVDGAFFASAEELIREVESGASLSGVIEALRVDHLALPEDVVLCTVARGNRLDNYALLEWEVDTIRIVRKHRRVDLRWTKRREGVKFWRCLMSEQFRDVFADYAMRAPEQEYMLRSVGPETTALALRSGIIVATDEVRVEGASDEAAVEIGGLFYVLPRSALGVYLRTWLSRIEETGDQAAALLTIILFDLALNTMAMRGAVINRGEGYGAASFRSDTGLTSEEVLRYLETRGLRSPPTDFDAAEFGAILSRRNTHVFSPSAWRRSERE